VVILLEQVTWLLQMDEAAGAVLVKMGVMVALFFVCLLPTTPAQALVLLLSLLMVLTQY
jgi:hypothetical protein